MTEQELYKFAYVGAQQGLFSAKFLASLTDFKGNHSELSLRAMGQIPYLEQCCVYLHNKLCERRPDDETDMQA